MRALLPLAFLCAQSQATLELVAGFTPSEKCQKHYESMMAKQITFHLNGEEARVLGAGSLRDINLEVGGTIYENPVKLFEDLLKADPAAAADPIIADAVAKMDNPVDRSGYAVICLSGACDLTGGGDMAYGKHSSKTVGLIRGGTPPIELDAAFRIMAGQVKKTEPPAIDSQIVATVLPKPAELNKDLNGSVIGWYATVLHESTHVTTEHLIIDWVTANRKLLLEGKRPDDHFLKYVKIQRGEWLIDNTFYLTLTEGIAYGVTGKAFDMIATQRKEPVLDPQWANIRFAEMPFAEISAVRPSITTELNVSAGNWHTRMREVREDMLRTIASAQ